LKLSETFYRALDLALTAHRYQKRRKWDNYACHLIEVALLLMNLGSDIPEYVIWAALLHDSIEDGYITVDTLVAAFGQETADLVVEVTDDPRLTRKEQKQHQIDSFASKTYWGKVLKLADRYSNACGHTGKSERTEKYTLHTLALLDAADKWCKSVQGHEMKYKYVFVLTDMIRANLK